MNGDLIVISHSLGLDRIAMTGIGTGGRSNFVTTGITDTHGGHRALGTAVAPPPCRS